MNTDQLLEQIDRQTALVSRLQKQLASEIEKQAAIKNDEKIQKLAAALASMIEGQQNLVNISVLSMSSSDWESAVIIPPEAKIKSS